MERTNFWAQTLASRLDDEFEADRDALRAALLKMRDMVIPFVRQIHRDVLGLTVHDESHLDALWEVADTLTGEDFDINPIEAFAFGAAVLLHDTGMAIAAFPGGIDEIKKTQAWSDIFSQISRARPSIDLNNLEKIVLFQTLRELHAQQAESLIFNKYKRPGKSEAIYLLEDIRIRDALGTSIGRIAHSHHWNSKDLHSKLNKTSGGIPGFPPQWNLNEVKVAALLRCADAAHIDSRRAPTMLFAISDVSGSSLSHWKFQNKLNQPTRSEDKLIFTSGQDFETDDAEDWWLAYDTIRMVDNELKNANAILEDIDCVSFSAKTVLGVESPKLLARYVRVKGWTPVDAEVKVTDPVGLAKTLGGKNLYGDGFLAPIRELLQNSVDAVRARRELEGRPADWGRIRVTFSEDDQERQWLYIDDQGVGMSERVLSSTLIDFGSSLWTSHLLRDEFPGLSSRSGDRIGKFGIGFFSVFLLGDHVEVISRRFNQGADEERVLQFNELSRRPLIRPAAVGELPLDYSTRVAVKLSKGVIEATESDFVRPRVGINPRFYISTSIMQMTAGVDVHIDFIDEINNINWSHDADWVNSDPQRFLFEVTGGSLAGDQINAMSDRVRALVAVDGTVYGRAVFPLVSELKRGYAPRLSVGGFGVLYSRC